MAEQVVKQEKLSIVRACELVCLSRSMWYYKTKRDDSEVIDKLTEMSEIKPNRGFDYYFYRIRSQGFKWNRKRVLRVYRLLGLQLRRKSKKRLPARVKTPLDQPQAPRQVWSADFMSDGLMTGRKFRVFNLIDDYNREALCTTPALSMPALRVVEYLRQAIEVYGKPLQIRVDNGPEFISKIFMSYCETEGIEINYIQPGKPSQNGYIERFNKTFREDVLDAYIFRNLEEVQQIAEDFREDYNKYHPHKSMGRKSPNQVYKEISLGLDPMKKKELFNLELSENG